MTLLPWLIACTDPADIPAATLEVRTDCATDWRFEDGRCVVNVPTSAPGACDPVHLGTPSGAIGNPCNRHEDCADDEFCGAGACRPSADELVTVCFEEGWYQGESSGDTAPNLYASLYFIDYGLNYGPYESLFTTVVDTCCHPVWRHCELWWLSNAAHHTLEIGRSRHRFWPLVFQFGSTPDWAWPGVAHRLVDQGCILFQNDASLDPRVAITMSFWYP